jgi:anti-sigma-K factor RskA
MTAYEHEEVKTMVAAYAIGAVPEDEMPAIRDHILSCEVCMAEADAYAITASALALTVAPAPLPVGFADRILEQVRPQQTETTPAKRSWSLFPRVAFGAVALVAIVLAGGLIDARNDAQEASRRLIALQQQAERNEAALSAFVHSDAGMRLEGSSGAVAQMVPTPDGATLAVAGLPEAPQGHVYQLWLVRGACGDQEPCSYVSGALFDVQEGLVVVQVDRSVRNFADAAVTLEPEGGSEGPTTKPLLITN